MRKFVIALIAAASVAATPAVAAGDHPPRIILVDVDSPRDIPLPSGSGPLELIIDTSNPDLCGKGYISRALLNKLKDDARIVARRLRDNGFEPEIRSVSAGQISTRTGVIVNCG